MALKTFYGKQASSIGSNAFCSGRAADSLLGSTQGATATSETAGDLAARGLSCASSATNVVAGYQECAAAVAAWAAGTYGIAFDVTIANMNLTLNEIHLCRVSSVNAAVATIGSLTGIARNLGSTGSVTHNVTGVADTHSSTDKLIIVFVLSNGAMSTQSVTARVTSATPIDTASGPSPLVLGFGAFAETGQEVTLKASRKISLGFGAFAATGQSVNLKRGFPLALGHGSFAESGQAVNLKRDARAALSHGVFAESGQDIRLLKGYRLPLDGGAGGGSTFVPTDKPNLEAWYDIESEGLANNATFTQFTDWSGNARHLTDIGGPLTALNKTGIFNGKAVARFVNGGPGADFNGAYIRGSFGATISHPYTIYFVFSKPDHIGGHRYFSSRLGGGPAYEIRNDGSAPSMTASDGVAGSSFTGPSTNTTCVIAIVVNGASSEIYVDGAAAQAITNGTGQITGVIFGANALASTFANMDMGAWLLYSGAHGTSDREELQAYLNDRFVTTAPSGPIFALTGQDVVLRHGYSMPVSHGSYVLSGQAIRFLPNYQIEIEAGIFTESGQAINLRRAARIVLDAGMFSETGQGITLRRAATLALGNGSFALSGQGLRLLKGLNIALEAGLFTETGQSINLRKGFSALLGTGNFALTGEDVRLLKGFLLSLGFGDFDLTGQDVTLNYAPNAAFEIALGFGEFALAGQSINLRHGRRIALDAGNFSLQGQQVSLPITRNVSLGAGLFTLSGQELRLLQNRSVELAPGIFAFTGQEIALQYGRRLRLEAGLFVLTGQDLTLTPTTIAVFPMNALRYVLAQFEGITSILPQFEGQSEILVQFAGETSIEV